MNLVGNAALKKSIYLSIAHLFVYFSILFLNSCNTSLFHHIIYGMITFSSKIKNDFVNPGNFFPKFSRFLAGVFG